MQKKKKVASKKKQKSEENKENEGTLFNPWVNIELFFSLTWISSVAEIWKSKDNKNLGLNEWQEMLL